MACPCRQRSTWPGPSARGSSNKDQPVWGTEQSTGHLLRTHMYTHTLSLSHTRTHMQGFTFAHRTQACGCTWSLTYQLQGTDPHRAVCKWQLIFLQQHGRIVTCTCITFSQLSTRTTLAHAHTRIYTHGLLFQQSSR